jgi:IS605 OrfB family transposase
MAWGRMERALHAELVAMARLSGRVATSAEMNALKTRFMEDHQTTSRHYNSLLFGLKGAHASRVACWKLELDDVEAKREARVGKRDVWAKRLAAHTKAVADIESRSQTGKAPTKAQRKALLSGTDVDIGRRVVFEHTRVIHRLERKAERIKADLARPVPRMVFGGVKRLRERARLEHDVIAAGGLPPTVATTQSVADATQSLADWRKGWHASRSSEIFVMGSSDETLGNQSCAFIVDQATGVGTLRLRTLAKETGYVVIPSVQLNAHAKRVLAHWLACTQAPRVHGIDGAFASQGKTPKAPKISFRFVRTVSVDSKEAARFSKPNARFSPWEVLITVDEVVPVAAPFHLGHKGGVGADAMERGAGEVGVGATGVVDTRPVLGVDVNGDHLACALTTPDGNPLASHFKPTRTGAMRSNVPVSTVWPTASGSGFWTIPMPLDGPTDAQRAAVMGDAVKQVMELAEAHGARLAIERLDFRKRKHEMLLTPGSARRNRALSAFPYALLHTLLTRAAARAGVAVQEINPAYTSVVGRIKVAPTRGVSTHQGAALTIARRALEHTEHYQPKHGRGSDGTALAAAEQDSGTSWAVWGKIHRLLRRQDAQAWLRRGERRAERPQGHHASLPNGGGAITWSGGDGIPDFPLPSPTGRHAEQLFAAEAHSLA